MLEWVSTPEKLGKEPIIIDLTGKYPTIHNVLTRNHKYKVIKTGLKALMKV